MSSLSDFSAKLRLFAKNADVKGLISGNASINLSSTLGIVKIARANINSGISCDTKIFSNVFIKICKD